MSLPSEVGLPSEMMSGAGSLDFSLPPDARSYSVKVQPSNISSVTGSISTGLVSAGNSMTTGDLAFPSAQLFFDLPCSQSSSTFLDPRFSTVHFTATLTQTGVVGTQGCNDCKLRSNANSYFDRMFITSQSGSVIEDISEYGLCVDTLLALQQNSSVRHGTALQYGFNALPVDTAETIGSNGHTWNVGCANTVGNSQSISYSVPLLSGILGCCSDKMLNIGRTSKMTVCLQTSNIAPISFYMSSATNTLTVPQTFQLTLSNFSIQCEYIDIGHSALSILDATLVDGKSYIHGTTYRTSSVTLPPTTGATSLLAGIRASSVKSLFCRFAQGGNAGSSNGAGNTNGKYDSVLPLLNSINYNIGGTRYPQVPLNPLLQPSQCFHETQMAIGSFNSSQFQSSISPNNYCKLTAGGTAQSLATAGVQDWNWNLGSSTTVQQQFIFGTCTEIVAKRSLLSGLNCTTSPIFLEMNVATQPTNSHTVYVQSMLDMVTIHNVKDGSIEVRI